jgi:hypothetical protein
MRLGLLAGATLGLLGLLACVTAPSDSQTVEHVPDRTTFAPVSDLLDRRCGALDCHGTTFRNLRIYGREGLRLSPTDRPTSVAGTTTVAEYDATFASLVALEPELMSAVVLEGGTRPERLTFVRKARGTEDHKGLAIWSAGDAADLCVTSWLSGKDDAGACAKALAAR